MSALKTEPLPDYGDHMLLEEFVKRCKDESFIDYDGYGHFATTTEMFSEMVYPSDVFKKNFKPKPEFTHVVWFNR